MTVRRPLLVGVVVTLTGLGLWASELRLKQVAYLNRGVTWTFGRVVLFRFSPDSSPLLVFRGNIPFNRYGVHFYHYVPWNRYRLVKVDTGSMGSGLVPGNMNPWDAADVNGDGHPELLAANHEEYSGGDIYLLVTLYVNPAQSLCPDSLVWRYSCDTNLVPGSEPCYITDLDQDGRAEIVRLYGRFLIFENAGPDSFRFVWTNPNIIHGYRAAFGDFDEDGRMEFATAGIDYYDWVKVLKCTGDDQYTLWDSVAIHLPNGHDVFSARNLDGSNRAVFFVSFINYENYHTCLYMFEPTQGTRGYEAVLIDSSLFTGWRKNALSCCADVDGDSIEELFWSCGSHLLGYRKTGPRQFEQVWYWWNQDSSSANLTAYDVNGNGYNELIMSGDGRTFIFEIEAVKVISPNGGERLRPGDTCLIRWQTFTPPRCDSVSLFLKTDTTIYPGERFWRLDTIVTGLSPSDSVYPWVVPDTQLAWAKVLAIAYGPGWQFDESDSAFRIVPGGVAEASLVPVREWSLSVLSVPATAPVIIRWQVSQKANVSLKVYDAAGQLVRTLASGRTKPGAYTAVWDGTDSKGKRLAAGVYFYSLETGEKKLSRKVVRAK